MRRRTVPTRPLLAACALLVAATVSCGDEGPVSAPGTLTAVVVSPNGSEGSAVVTLFGDGIESVSALDGWVFKERGEGQVRVVVVNDGPGALRFLVAVADTTRPLDGFVEEVADPDDRLRGATGGYTLEFVR